MNDARATNFDSDADVLLSLDKRLIKFLNRTLFRSTFPFSDEDLDLLGCKLIARVLRNLLNNPLQNYGSAIKDFGGLWL